MLKEAGESVGVWTVVVGTAAWLVRELVPLWKRRWQRREVEATKRAYRAQAEVWEALERGRHEARAARTLLIVASNGGGRPDPPSQVGVSIRFCTVGDGVRQIREQFENWPPDAQYAQLLAKVAEAVHRPVELVTSDMAPGMLRDLYASDGFLGSHVFLAAHIAEKRWMVYASICYSERGAKVEDGRLVLDAEQRAAERAMVSRIRAILEESWEGVL